MIYDLSMFGNYSLVLRQRSSVKCGWTVFEIVSPTDNFETIKNGITIIAKLLQ